MLVLQQLTCLTLQRFATSLMETVDLASNTVDTEMRSFQTRYM